MSATSGATNAAFDPKQSREQEFREASVGRAVRPRDAATLILVRNDGATPQVLMGQRHANHKFMPNKFVFPGGRVDPADSRVRPADGPDARHTNTRTRPRTCDGSYPRNIRRNRIGRGPRHRRATAQQA